MYSIDQLIDAAKSSKGITSDYKLAKSIGAMPRPSNVKTRPLKPRCLTTIRPRNHHRLSTWFSPSAFTVRQTHLD